MAAEAAAEDEMTLWLKSMPVAPEYHPTLNEFQDPIAYIFKIEKEASEYGICKIVPPVRAASRKTVVSNFNKSLMARSGDPSSAPTFTTRQQQIGFCPRKHRPVQKSVWQSGERYTLSEFEAKAKNFEKSYLKKYAKKGLNSLEMESLFWNAMVDKPFKVEYANDMPGSAFMVQKSTAKRNENAAVVGETQWNMRRVSRENLSLLRFMKEEIPGVTSPMVYVAMMFSWFAWHVEDHDFHSLNYLHMGAGKTWYGVPREAAVAFEEVIREHGYGGEINPLLTFTTLGEKTTVMSPEVLLNAGVPCCRLVQNAGEFVVTFPRAYHSGFSHGFNCGEAANIATPEWLKVAKEAAIRRAAINYPPMVSHIQLLYDLALSFSSSVPKSPGLEPRSSRLKDKKKGEGEKFIKEMFLEDMLLNNDMLRILAKGSSVVVLPQSFISSVVCSDAPDGFQSTTTSKPFTNLLSSDNFLKTVNGKPHDAHRPDKDQSIGKEEECFTLHGKSFSSLCSSSEIPFLARTRQMGSELKRSSLHELGLFSCVSCGVLCFACVAIVRPTEAAACYISSADCSLFNCLKLSGNVLDDNRDARAHNTNFASALTNGMLRNESIEEEVDMVSSTKVKEGPSSLGLLALAYGNSSDSEEEDTSNDAILAEGCDASKYDSPELELACHSTAGNSMQVSDSVAKSDILIATRNDGEARMISSTCVDEPIPDIGLEGTAHFSVRSNEDSFRLHVFCLEHALQVEKQLSQIGGAHVFLACHPDYPMLESQAKKITEEIGSDCVWSELSMRQSNEEDEKIIKLALESENGIHGNGDWAVKLGINLFYSASLSRSPLYSKQMHYNSIIYVAFGRTSPTGGHRLETEIEGKGFSRRRRTVVAGKWCGRVWTSSQAHPMLVNRDSREEKHDSCLTPNFKGDKEVHDAEEASSIGITHKKRKKRSGRTDVGLSFHDSPSIPKEENIDEESELSEHGRRQTKVRHGNKKRKKETSECEDLHESSEEFPLSNTWKRIKGQVAASKRVMKQKEASEKEEEAGPSTRLRKRMEGNSVVPTLRKKPPQKEVVAKKRGGAKVRDEESEYTCEMEGCSMSFGSKQELSLHERNICPVKSCGKKFFSHKYLVQHRRVHMDDRPLKCPWKGCKMAFKWAWARTEHIRVHTGARPYVCTETGCGQTFRFVSDFSRHKRKTGHTPKKVRGG